jgi:plastocyanin
MFHAARTRSLSLAALGVLVAVLVAACSSGSSVQPAAVSQAPVAPTGMPSSAGGDPGAVTIKDFAFAPGSITVAAGTTVTWTNQDSASHTVTADDGSFDSKALATGATFSQTFPTAGSFTYHCAIHTSMTATVVVQ